VKKKKFTLDEIETIITDISYEYGKDIAGRFRKAYDSLKPEDEFEKHEILYRFKDEWPKIYDDEPWGAMACLRW